MKGRLLTVVLALFSLFAQGQYTVSGIVKDKESGDMLPGAHIRIPGTYLAAVSDEDGWFSIYRVKTGSYKVVVTYIGYEDKSISIDVKDNVDLEISMEPAVIVEDEVIITATRAAAKSPTTYSTLSKREIEEMNMGQDLPYLMNHEPGVVTTSDAGNGVGYTGIRIRGTDLFRINVTMNGIPLNDAESQGVWWVDLPDLAASVDNIQIQRGVGTSTNGAAAFGASINILTQSLRPDPYAEVNANYGSFNTKKINFKAGSGLIKEKWAFDASYSRILSDGFIDRASSNLRSFYVSGGYYGRKTLVKFSVISGKEKTYQAWDGVPSFILDTNRTYNGLGAYYDLDGNLQYYDNQTDNYDQYHYQVFLARQITQTWNLTTAFHFTKGAGYYEEYKVDESFSSYGLPPVMTGNDTITSTNLVRQRWLDNDFYGLTFAINHDNRSRLTTTLGGSFSYYEGDHFGDIIWSEYAGNYDYPYRWHKNTGIKNDANIYAKASWQLTKKLNIYGDLQYRRVDYRIDGLDNDFRDITQAHLFNFFNPKAGLFYEFNNRNKAYLSFAIANREPNRAAFIDANPTQPYPTHETLYDAEAGYNLLSGRFSFDGTLYYMVYRNQLVLTGQINDVGDPILVNVPNSYRAGIELSAVARVARFLEWTANLALSENRIRDFREYIDNWDDYPNQIENELGDTYISFSPALIINNILDFEPVDNLNIKLFSKYVSRQYIDNTSSKERSLAPYFVNDLLLKYSFFPSFLEELTLQFKANNIFGHEYEANAWVYRYYSEGEYGLSDGYFPQAGINFMGGVIMRF